MYIQITSRCNMSCAHCCMNATAKGSDITIENFRKAIEVAKDHCDYLMIGGGEPTCHPDFELIMYYAIVASNDEGKVAIVTNGKITERAMQIHSLTVSGVLQGELSQDCFHDPIDPKVVKAFRDYNWIDNYGIKKKRSLIRDTTFDGNREPAIISGREVQRRGLSRRPRKDSCPCDDTFVRPNGKIYQCGCYDSPCIGDVNKGYNSPCPGACYRSDEYKKESAA